MSILIAQDDNQIVISQAQGIEGIQGPQGDHGESGALNVTVPSNIPILNGYTVVAMNNSQLVIADNTDLNLINKIIGITKTSASAGESVIVMCSGGHLTGLAGLTIGGKIYLSSNGTITQTIPTSGFVIQLGTALSATSIAVNITSAILTI